MVDFIELYPSSTTFTVVVDFTWFYTDSFTYLDHVCGVFDIRGMAIYQLYLRSYGIADL